MNKKDFEYDYTVTVNTDGSVTLKGAAPDPLTSLTDSITPTGAVFTPGDNPVYIPLEQSLTTNEVLYTFTLADDWNLKSTPAEASISSKKLAEPYFTDLKDYLITKSDEITISKIPQDNNSSFATFNLIPALITYWFEDKTTGIIQNKYYVDEGEVSVAKNFIFDETKITKDDTIQAIIETLDIPSYAYLKENGNKVNLKEKLNSNPWNAKNANTSKCTIEYSVSQIQDDGTTTPLFSSSFDSEESSGSSPQKQKQSNQTYKLNNSGNTLKSSGHYTSVELPGGELLVTIYAHKTGFADSNPVEYKLEVLRTRVFVSGKDGVGNNETNNGSANSKFKTITHAANKLSTPGDSANTIYLDTDLTENIDIPAGTYVTIKPTEGTRTITAETATDAEGNALPLLKIGDNATVVLENLILKDGDIEVGEGAKLYLNDVEFIGKTVTKDEERNKIHIASTGIVILGGKTTIDSDTAYIALEEGGKVQLGNIEINTPSKVYTSQQLVVLQTVKDNPTLNTILLETEYLPNTTYRPIQRSYPSIYNDLTNESDPYKLFKLNNSGYYIGFDDEMYGTETAGRGLVKIPAVNITEPEVGGFTVILSVNQEEELRIKKGNKVTFTIKRNGQVFDKATDLKLELRLEDDVIETSKKNQQSVQELTIPSTYPSGYYTIDVYFTYDGIKYLEHFNVYMEAD